MEAARPRDYRISYSESPEQETVAPVEEDAAEGEHREGVQAAAHVLVLLDALQRRLQRRGEANHQCSGAGSMFYPCRAQQELHERAPL